MKRLLVWLAVLALAMPMAAQMANLGAARAMPAAPPITVAPAIAPGAVAVRFGGNPSGKSLVGFPARHGFSHQHQQQVFLGGFYDGFYGYDNSYPTVVYQMAPQTSLPQPVQPVFEEREPSAPLIIEKVGDQWVRRRVVESDEGAPYRDEQARATKRPCNLRDKSDKNCRK